MLETGLAACLSRCTDDPPQEPDVAPPNRATCAHSPDPMLLPLTHCAAFHPVLLESTWRPGNSYTHRNQGSLSRRQDKLAASEARRAELQAQVKQLTMANAGLRAHNHLLEAAEQERLSAHAPVGDLSMAVGCLLPVRLYQALEPLAALLDSHVSHGGLSLCRM